MAILAQVCMKLIKSARASGLENRRWQWAIPQRRNDSQSSIVLSLSGLTACTLTYPLDVVRSRLAFQVADEEIYCGVCHAIQQIFTTEGGFCALYKGYGATAVSMIPAVGKSSEYVNIVNSVLIDETLVFLL